MSGILIVTENRKARHDYEILETFEAGLVLEGREVKALRERLVQLKDSYVDFRGSEAFIRNMHVSEYKHSHTSTETYNPEQLRKLLLKRRQIDYLYGAVREKGLTVVPLKVYFKNGIAKMEIGLARGKKLHDKRQALKKRSSDEKIRKNLGRRTRPA